MDPRLYAVARASVRAVNTPIAKSRLTKALANAPRPFKLEIGGLQRRDGWVVTNVNAVTRNYLDATTTWPLEDGSVSHVYNDNVIEHVPLEAARRMLAEAYRCLRPGGVIRTVTPDIRAHIDLYLSGRSAVDSEPGRQYRALGLTVEHPIDLVRIPIGSFGHHVGYLYDFETLDAELQRAGFRPAVRVELGQSEHPELRGLDTRTDEAGAQFAVEAVK
ncbi:class I SAM-dependent methyltransferase [Jatrophihabitans fulvus]